MHLLTINAGSSSVKFALFLAGAGQLEKLFVGQFERVGVAPVVSVSDAEGTVLAETTLPEKSGHGACIAWLTDWLDSRKVRIDAVAHRVVHGGTRYTAPVRVTAEVLADLERFISLAPLHQPHNLAGLRFIAQRYPDLPQVACFDTSFHTTQSDEAQMFALPRAYFDRGIRAYGFHGLSYDFVARQAAVAPFERVVVMHLGSGASACALQNGQSVASTMGFTALDGLMMGTRCGNLDPGVVLQMLREGDKVEDVEATLYKKSGLLGVSGLSSDIRDLVKASAEGHEGAHQALNLFTMSVATNVAKLVTRLGGVDALVFTAGIGEHSAVVRSMVCERLSWMGVRLNEQANSLNADNLTGSGSSVTVLKVHTDEEQMMARHGLGVLTVPADCPKHKRVACEQCPSAA